MTSVLEQNLDKPKSLCEWVRNFRIKKISMKRRRGSDLRVTAILTTALIRAETELRRKQSERALKWSELQSKFLCKDTTSISHQNSLTTSTYDNQNTNFMYNDDDESEKRRVQVENFWKCELSGLDDFFNNLSHTKRKDHHDDSSLRTS